MSLYTEQILSNKMHFKDAMGPLVGTNKVPLSANISLWLFLWLTALVKGTKTKHQGIN